jgi:hypothetical protein
MQAVWVDPVCGDGICEAPWEFASYSTFGCRADCGRLQDIQNLTKLQIDMYWDFSHPVGSIPASVCSVHARAHEAQGMVSEVRPGLVLMAAAM